MHRRVHISVSGRVQGVAYRASAQRQASDLNLNGWVRNTSDGRVEILAEGEEMAIAAFIEWCRHGPRWARVDSLQVADAAAGEAFYGFAVRRDE
ncbi:MAG: acylphosphatase [Candidatus Methylumidiphilus sp.]